MLLTKWTEIPLPAYHMMRRNTISKYPTEEYDPFGLKTAVFWLKGSCPGIQF